MKCDACQCEKAADLLIIKHASGCAICADCACRMSHPPVNRMLTAADLANREKNLSAKGIPVMPPMR